MPADITCSNAPTPAADHAGVLLLSNMLTVKSSQAWLSFAAVCVQGRSRRALQPTQQPAFEEPRAMLGPLSLTYSPCSQPCPRLLLWVAKQQHQAQQRLLLQGLYQQVLKQGLAPRCSSSGLWRWAGAMIMPLRSRLGLGSRSRQPPLQQEWQQHRCAK